MLPPLRLLCVWSVLATVAPAQRVWVVAPAAGPGVDFTDIQLAINAAADGDTVWVRSGTYRGFEVVGKALAVLGNGSVGLDQANPYGVRIRNLTVQQSAVVRGFMGLNYDSPLLIDSCQGPVTVEDVDFRATGANSAAQVTNATQVTLSRCRLRGGTFSALTSQSNGLAASTSTVQLYDCTIDGGSALGIARGGAGVQLDTTTMIAHRSALVGGPGSPGRSSLGFCFANPSPGGHGIELRNGSTAFCVDSRVEGGPAGAPGGCPPASNGQPFVGNGTVTLRQGANGHLVVASPVRTGHQANFTLTGPPNAGAWLLLSARQNPVFFAGCLGALYVDFNAMVVLFVGALPANGQMVLGVPIPPSLTTEAVTLFIQSGFTPTGGCFLGTPSALTILDARFS